VIFLLRGKLVETYGVLSRRTRLRQRVIGPGYGLAFGADHVHDLVNNSPATATSLHVYSPHLSHMTYYSPDLAPLHTEPLVLGQHVG
jgi:hypothetical protein